MSAKFTTTSALNGFLGIVLNQPSSDCNFLLEKRVGNICAGTLHWVENQLAPVPKLRVLVFFVSSGKILHLGELLPTHGFYLPGP